MNRIHALLCVATLAALVSPSPAAFAKRHDRGLEPLTCDDGDRGDDSRASHCEIRETAIEGFAGSVHVDPGMNGGASVHGWDRSDTLVRVRVRTYGDTDADAEALAKQIRVPTAGG